MKKTRPPHQPDPVERDWPRHLTQFPVLLPKNDALGRQAYRLRERYGTPWRAIAREIGANSDIHAWRKAWLWAKRQAKPWPPGPWRYTRARGHRKQGE